MIRTVIIEDEKLAVKRLEKLLSQFSDIEIVKSLYSVEDAIAWFENNQHPQLIFSDIVLGDGLSFEIFDKIKTKSFFIYTTAFDQYTLKAFKLNSIDYLLKPIELDDLEKAIEKFKSFLPEQNFLDSNEIRAIVRNPKTTLSRVLVKIGYNLKVISVADISCFYSENKIVYLQTKERNYPTDFTLDELEDVLDEANFFRVNRQFIISSDYIKNIHTSPIYKIDLQFQPNQEISISRDRVRDFKNWLSM